MSGTGGDQSRWINVLENPDGSSTIKGGHTIGASQGVTTSEGNALVSFIANEPEGDLLPPVQITKGPDILPKETKLLQRANLIIPLRTTSQGSYNSAAVDTLIVANKWQNFTPGWELFSTLDNTIHDFVISDTGAQIAIIYEGSYNGTGYTIKLMRTTAVDGSGWERVSADKDIRIFSSGTYYGHLLATNENGKWVLVTKSSTSQFTWYSNDDGITWNKAQYYIPGNEGAGLQTFTGEPSGVLVCGATFLLESSKGYITDPADGHWLQYSSGGPGGYGFLCGTNGVSVALKSDSGNSEMYRYATMPPGNASFGAFFSPWFDGSIVTPGKLNTSDVWYGIQLNTATLYAYAIDLSSRSALTLPASADFSRYQHVACGSNKNIITKDGTSIAWHYNLAMNAYEEHTLPTGATTRKIFYRNGFFYAIAANKIVRFME